MSRIFLCVTLMAAMLACNEASPPAAPESDAVPKQTASPMGDGPTEVEMVASMEGHYSVIILAHDGDITVDRGRWNGARFTITLPRRPAETTEHLHA